jgi:putative hydrolase of the HAD superfamily
MKFYKPLRTFKAISFDLDDTLYDNHPIIDKAEADFLIYLQTTYPKLSQLEETKWQLYKKIIKEETPELQHDVTLCRKEIIKRVMVIYGMPMVDAIKNADIALQKFITLRSDFSVTNEIISFLKKLADHYPIIAITNGNVDIKQIGLQDHFSFILKAGNGLNSKPHADLFKQAASLLNIEVSELLHVGDNLITDVYGAQNNNAQAVWFNPNQLSLDGAKLLPCMEIDNIESLLKIL